MKSLLLLTRGHDLQNCQDVQALTRQKYEVKEFSTKTCLKLRWFLMWKICKISHAEVFFSSTSTLSPSQGRHSILLEFSPLGHHLTKYICLPDRAWETQAGQSQNVENFISFFIQDIYSGQDYSNGKGFGHMQKWKVISSQCWEPPERVACLICAAEPPSKSQQIPVRGRNSQLPDPGQSAMGHN